MGRHVVSIYSVLCTCEHNKVRVVAIWPYLGTKASFRIEYNRKIYRKLKEAS